MGLYSWLMAQCYDMAMANTEQLCLNGWRRDLLACATGDVLEIGAGTGVNLQHFPAHCRLIISEPDAQMRKKLQDRLQTTELPAQLVDWPAEQLKLPNHSIDTVVTTLVLCSVADQQQALKEIYRVLRPGGQLLFIEHVRSGNRKTERWQRFCEPVWRCACGNCHLTRDTAKRITETGLEIEKLLEAELLGAPAIVRRTLRGRAIKAPASTGVNDPQPIDPNNFPSCPHCGAADVAKVIYGKPPLTRQILAALESGQIISGGCMIHGGAPEWHCLRCRQDFGHRSLPMDTTVEQT